MFFYCESIQADFSEITDEQAHHISRVLRLQKGDSIKLFDGKGITASGLIADITKNKVSVSVQNIEQHEPQENGRVIIAASIAKGERFDWLIGKCTELGVDVIWPVLFERTVKQGGLHSVERFEKLALAAAKQCERPFLPMINTPTKLADSLDLIKKDFANSLLLFGSMDENAPSVFGQLAAQKDCAAFIGPEGGITDKELELLKSAGAQGVRLTNTILRTETAAEAFAAILCSRPGNSPA